MCTYNYPIEGGNIWSTDVTSFNTIVKMSKHLTLTMSQNQILLLFCFLIRVFVYESFSTFMLLNKQDPELILFLIA